MSKMAKDFCVDSKKIDLQSILAFVFARENFKKVSLSSQVRKNVEDSHRALNNHIEKNVPIYGVTTGYGDSCFRVIQKEQSEKLQNNLIDYLTCGTGAKLPEKVARAVMVARLISLCRGYSGVSVELVERLALYVENGWCPIIPREGSLGASGDLIPLAYLAQVLQGHGDVLVNGERKKILGLLKENSLEPYRLKPKEGLALVNGTSAMSGVALVNLNNARFLNELGVVCSAWLCLSLKGRTEAFGTLVNKEAKTFRGQARIAAAITDLLMDEDYKAQDLSQIKITNGETSSFVQDPYSLRCAPQILGPVSETIDLVAGWIESEINGVSDNPLVNGSGELANGGNFYGGYISQGMDYLKISLGHLADQMDRQLALVINDRTNRGLTPNLANWFAMDQSNKFLHHGLKGLHQLVSAITAEILPRTIPNGIFSRSAESHNQDKISLGMSAAVQCSDIIDALYNLFSAYLVCLAQALDMRKIVLKGEVSRQMYDLVRGTVSFVDADRALHDDLELLADKLRARAEKNGRILD